MFKKKKFQIKLTIVVQGKGIIYQRYYSEDERTLVVDMASFRGLDDTESFIIEIQKLPNNLSEVIYL